MQTRWTWDITLIYYIHNRGPYSVAETILFRGDQTEGKVIKRIALNFILFFFVLQPDLRGHADNRVSSLRRQKGGPHEVGGEVREEERAVCQLQFREKVLRKEKELLSTSPGSTQVKEVAKCSNVVYSWSHSQTTFALGKK